jgi:GTP cyclohydrolase II
LRYDDADDIISETFVQLDSLSKEGKRLNPYIHRFNETEQKDVGIGAQILNDVGIRKVKLLTNNPRKRVGLYGYGIEVVEEVPYH